MMPYRILSLSGGGMRGIFQAEFLQRVSADLPKPLSSNFDLIAGASTGSIIGFGIALDINLELIVKLFSEQGPKIFKSRWCASFRRGPRYSREPLEAALKEVFKTKCLKDLPDHIDVAITAADLDSGSHRVFTVLSRSGDSEFTIVDTILASCAAPTYFPAVTPLGSNRTYVDGGIWANTPTLVAVLEANTHKRIPFQEMRVLSLGNGRVAVGSRPGEFNRLRPISLEMFRSLLDLWMSTQSAAADDFAKTLVGTEHMLQINPYLRKPISLDDARPAALKELRAIAEEEAEKTETSALKELLAHSSKAEAVPSGLNATSNNLPENVSDIISERQFPAEMASLRESLKEDYIQREPQFASNLPADWLQKEILYFSASAREEREKNQESLLQELRKAEASSGYKYFSDEHHKEMVDYVQKLREKYLRT
jgi:uncharacterized protein